MLKIDGERITQAGALVGYIEGMYIKDEEGKKLGYFEGNYVFDENGKKLSYIEGDRLYSYESRSSYVELTKVNEKMEASVLPEIARCAVYQLIGA